MDNYYRKQLEILVSEVHLVFKYNSVCLLKEEDVPLRYEESFQQPPEVHLPNDIVFGETPEIVVSITIFFVFRYVVWLLLRISKHKRK